MQSRIGTFCAYLLLVPALVLISALEMQGQATAGTLRGQVMDPSGAVIPEAVVVLKGPDGKSASVKTDSTGSYEIRGLSPGNYAVQVTAKGFKVFTSHLDMVASQTRRLDVALQISTQNQQIVVEGHHDSGAVTLDVDPSNNGGGITVKGKNLEALSDDPDDLQAELQELAGPAAGPNGGQIYIDGFTGGQLPPKPMIREVRINQNPFSAEKDKVGFGRIEVFTLFA